jgi:excinuclease ABC subunit C
MSRRTSAEPPADLLARIDRFPGSPGVYIMKDASSRIIYIGKAVNLRSRVRSYFGKASDTRVFHSFLVDRIADVDCIVAESEAEALILENNLIKKHRPIYNIRLKDDKTYVSIKVTVAEEWPRVLVVRRYKKDGNLYFGPYGSASAVREMLRVIKTVFPLRTCSNAFFTGRTRPCIEHEIGRCTAPCVDLITREKYREDVEEVILFLKGKTRDLIRIIDEKMQRAASLRQYELAARYRDQIRAIEKVFETQKAQDWDTEDIDVFATAREGDMVAVEEVLVRSGKIVNSHCHTFRTSLETPEVMASFLCQYYLSERYVPREILCDTDFPDRPLVEEWLRTRRGARVTIEVPERGDKARIVELARKNAVNSFALRRTEEERIEAIIASLGQKLGMSRPPRRIECFDISNFQGSLTVGSLVHFEDGRPVKDRYRKYRIQTVVGADDFRSMREVLERRARSGIEANDLPDLILVDGGKGQLGVATGVLEGFGISDRVAVAALAKERRSRRTAERVFVPGRADPLPLSQDSPESLHLQRIRDEAHRFAVRYHRELRKKATLRTGLEGIPGVGKKRTDAILAAFGTLKNIRRASEADIARVVGERLARAIHEKVVRGHEEPPGPGPEKDG